MINITFKKLALLAAVGAFPLIGTASSLLIDRGLPTANLNNAAGANRSNVSWAYPSVNGGTWLFGDDFTNTSASAYQIDTIRLWTTGATSTAELWGGTSDAAAFSLVSNAYTATSVQYGNGATYQGSGGGFSTITQIDFAVNLLLGAGETFNFFFNGTPAGTYHATPFVHASNALLSGSSQEGANNSYLYGYLSGGTILAGDWGADTSLGNGWDKASDLNVQVFGQAVPEAGSTLVLLGLGLAAVAASRSRRKA